MPTNSQIPTHSAGDVLPVADWNTLYALNTDSALYAVGSTMSGSAPVSTAPNFLIQAGVQGVGFSSGAGTLTFPVSFPNGLLTVLTTIQVPASSSSSTCGPVNGGSFSATSVALWAAISGSALNSNYNVNYIAIGF